jgi:hypothetical protein
LTTDLNFSYTLLYLGDKNMVQAKWMRINPAQLMMPGTGKMSVMVMATAAKIQFA